MAGVVIFSAPMVAALLGLNFSGLGMALLLPTPGGSVSGRAGFASTTVSKPNFFWSLVVSHALGWLFIAAASRMVVRNFAREEPRPVRDQDRPRFESRLALYPRSTEQKPCRLVFLLAALVAMIVVVAMLISPRAGMTSPPSRASCSGCT
jgi:hypothetical protein